MPRRVVTFVAAGLLVFGLVFGGALVPVPYVALLPGPTENVLGKSSGQPLISIEDHRTYRHPGHLNLVTVRYRGGPGSRLDLVTALRGWVDPDVAVVPERAVFPEDSTAEEVERTTARRMRQSQQHATVAALRELGMQVQEEVVVRRVQQGYPAQGVLRSGDVLVAVEGTRIDTARTAAETVGSTEPGGTVTVTVKRDQQTRRLQVGTTAAEGRAQGAPDRAVMGVLLRSEYEYPIDVQIRIDDIGGPSAGLMFALGIVDMLTEGDITGGKFIAGTGSITPTGEVRPIGGIAQKLQGARADGATVFLTPAGNCAAASTARPEGMRLVKVETLQGARSALRVLRTGEGSVPSC